MTHVHTRTYPNSLPSRLHTYSPKAGLPQVPAVVIRPQMQVERRSGFNFGLGDLEEGMATHPRVLAQSNLTEDRHHPRAVADALPTATPSRTGFATILNIQTLQTLASDQGINPDYAAESTQSKIRDQRKLPVFRTKVVFSDTTRKWERRRGLLSPTMRSLTLPASLMLVGCRGPCYYTRLGVPQTRASILLPWLEEVEAYLYLSTHSDTHPCGKEDFMLTCVRV